MQKRLRRCVGKFVKMRGSPQILHFMELKEFLIEDALDYSHLFFLRALRMRLSEHGLREEGLLKWMEGTGVRFLAELVLEVLKNQADREGCRLTVTEFYPGVGLTFEYIKYLLDSPTPSCKLSVRDLHYEGCGPASYRLKFEVLHQNDVCTFRYFEENLTGRDYLANIFEASNLVFFNHHQSIRYKDETQLTIEQFLHGTRVPAILAVRVVSSENDELKTTVKGRTMKIPSISRILGLCHQNDPFWCYRVVPSLDAAFFLPDGGAEINLMLAYSLRKKVVLPGYATIRTQAPVK